MSSSTSPRWVLKLPRFSLRGSEGLGMVLLLGFLCALFFVPYVWRFESRDKPVSYQKSGALWMRSLPGAQVLESLEYWLYDLQFGTPEAPSLSDRVLQFGIGTPELPARHDRIVIVAIDQNSLGVKGEWPWPRAWHARLIDRLKKAGARVIGFDFDFSDHQNPLPNGDLSHDDLALIKAIHDAKNVVLPTGFNPNLSVFSSGFYQLSAPFSEDDKGHAGLDEETPDLAINYQPADSDNGHRRYPFVARSSGAQIGSFAALICALYQKISLGEENTTYERSLRRHEWPSLRDGIADVPTRLTAFPGPAAPQFDLFLLRYRSPRAFATYSYVDVLENYNDTKLKHIFKDKIVLVGATAGILKDTFPAPGGSEIAGVEMHAGAVCQLLEDRFIIPPELTTTLNNLFGMALVSALWPQLTRSRISRLARRSQERWKGRKRFKKWRFRVQDTLWFLLTGAVALLPGLGFWGLCILSFRRSGQWMVAAYPLLASLLAASLAMVYLFTVETAQRRKVMSQVGLYLDSDIMETILAHPEEDYPRPRRTTATVMFTDLQGFTPYTELHTPDEVVSALNAYMSRLHPIIKKHHGSVDKYIGDAIMAYFGVPVPFTEHAACGLRCAIEIQEECALFREETGIPFYTRIGLHTGELIAGSIGSQSSSASLVNYTVIGDTVNLASRLEAKNKDFGSWILCSRDTFEIAPDVALVEPVRDTIKGKSQEVEMFIVRGMAGQEPRDEFWGEKSITLSDKAA